MGLTTDDEALGTLMLIRSLVHAYEAGDLDEGDLHDDLVSQIINASTEGWAFV